MGSPKQLYIRGEDDFSYGTQGLFLLIPGALLGILFVFRRRLSGASKNAKLITTVSLGTFAILGELGFDISSIENRDVGVSRADAMGSQFVGGGDFCRMNAYIVGVFLILQRKEMIKGVAATALFGGYSTLINHYGPEADVHSLITHAIILCVFAAVGATMGGSNYKVRNLIHSHIFNGILVIFMYFVVNNKGGGYAGELRKENMDNNMMVGFAPGPINMFLGILAVMFLEGIYFFVFRIIGGRTYVPKKSFAYTFKMEGPFDKAEGYGYKLGGKDSGYLRNNYGIGK